MTMHVCLCRTLPLAERVTMLPWLYSVLDYDATASSYDRYDKMSARDMFERWVAVLCLPGSS